MKVAVVMGSQSDWDTMKETVAELKKLNIDTHSQVLSAHRTPDLMFEFAQTAAAQGFCCIIAGAGGAAHLPGMLAAKTWLPVIGVPIQSKVLNGLDSLLSIVQMPAGVPVATVAIGKAGARNAALLAARFIAPFDAEVRKQCENFNANQTQQVLDNLSLED